MLKWMNSVSRAEAHLNETHQRTTGVHQSSSTTRGHTQDQHPPLVLLEVSLLPAITRKPAAFPRHWPCLGGRFREFWGLFRTVRLTRGPVWCWFIEFPLAHVHILSYVLTSYFTKLICLPLLEQLSWWWKPTRISLTSAIDSHCWEYEFYSLFNLCFYYVADKLSAPKTSPDHMCPRAKTLNLPAHCMSVMLCCPTLSYVIEWKSSSQEISHVTRSPQWIISSLPPLRPS